MSTQPVSEPEHDHVVVREVLRGYRLHGRVARASRVIVGQYREGGVATGAPAEGLIGADERAAAEEAAAAIAAADTIPLDEATIRQIFGDPEEKS